MQIDFQFIGEAIEPQGNTPGSSSFVVDILGGYNDALTFIEGIEEGRFLVALDSFSITKERNGFEVEIKGLIYFRD